MIVERVITVDFVVCTLQKVQFAQLQTFVCLIQVEATKTAPLMVYPSTLLEALKFTNNGKHLSK